jgi:hypothetical protein
MNFRVVVNSTGRADTLAAKTLPMLRRGGIEPEVWVSSLEERDEYAAVVDAPLFVAPHDPTDRSIDVVGKHPVGLGLARNVVLSHAEPGERIVFVDDDLTGVSRAISPKALEQVHDLERLFGEMFRATANAWATLWGLYPVPNAYFMKPRVRYDLTYVCGGLFGVIVTGKPHELVTLDDKEDFERSIRHYLADGVVVRNERYCLGTTGYTGRGGMQLSRTPLRVRASAEWLAARYPGLCSVNNSKRSGWTEVRLRDRRQA